MHDDGDDHTLPASRARWSPPSGQHGCRAAPAFVVAGLRRRSGHGFRPDLADGRGAARTAAVAGGTGRGGAVPGTRDALPGAMPAPPRTALAGDGRSDCGGGPDDAEGDGEGSGTRSADPGARRPAHGADAAGSGVGRVARFARRTGGCGRFAAVRDGTTGTRAARARDADAGARYGCGRRGAPPAFVMEVDLACGRRVRHGSRGVRARWLRGPWPAPRPGAVSIATRT